MPTLNPFIKTIIGSVVRHLVGWAAGFLAAYAGVTLTESQITEVVAWLTPVIAMLAWSFYQKYTSRQKQLIAQSAPGPITEHQVEAMQKTGDAPSVMTPKHAVPR